MPKIFIISDENDAVTKLGSELVRSYPVNFGSSQDRSVTEQISKHTPDLVLLKLNDHSEARELTGLIKKETGLPIIALVGRNAMNSIDRDIVADDFLTSPYDVSELVVRMNRLIGRRNTADNNEIVGHNRLVINIAKCEVTVRGRIVELTFKEYELLKFLAANSGLVFNRQTLLDKVWGYDYYGGDRTVDVHIRRLRSKIEDSHNTYIETVRNIGYRFVTTGYEIRDM